MTVTSSYIDFAKPKKRVYFPASWLDLQKYNTEEFFKFLEIAFSGQGKIERNTKLASLFLHKYLQKLEPSYLQIAVQAFNFVDAPELFKLPTYKDLHLRGDALQKCTLDEFVNADTYYYYLCHSEQKTEMLNKLVSVLLRPKDSKFISTEIEAHEEDIKQVPTYYKLAVLHYFVSCKIALQHTFPDVLGEPAQEDVEGEEKKERPTPPPPNWNQLVIFLVGDDLAKIKEIEQTNIYSVLLFLREKQKKS